MPPEHRRCPVTGRWAVVAPERGERPIELADSNPHSREPDPGGHCPFCPGSEADTPDPVYEVRGPAGWMLRVVPNRFPAVRPDAPGGFGHHEVLIDTPRHESGPGRLSVAETAASLTATRERVRALAATPGVRHVAAFRNVGAEAGASLAHPHGQILATPFVPADVAAEWAFAGDRCPTCELLERPERVITAAPGWVAVCPPAGRFDHEVWVLPTRHADLCDTTDAELVRLAGLLRRVRRAVDAALGRPAYNEVVRTAAGRHLRLELLPRTARAAGFELGTGCSILTVTPEQSAELLRAALEGDA